MFTDEFKKPITSAILSVYRSLFGSNKG